MLIHSTLISSPTGEAIRAASVQVSDIATPRSIAYRVKRALNVSAVRSHPPTFNGDGMRIQLIGADCHIEAERADFL